MTIENSETNQHADERGNGIQVIARAAAILNTLGGIHAGLSLAEIAKKVDLPRSTVQRIVQALAREDMVQADRTDGVRLGPALLRLVARVHTDVVAVVHMHMRHLSEEIEETIALGRISGRQLAFIHAAVAERQLRVVPQVGSNLPLHSTSGGRALLALLSDDEVLTLVGPAVERVTDKTLDSAAQLVQALATVRRDGYAVECDETESGISSVAIAIDSVLGQYSMSVVIPSGRFDAKRNVVIERILALKRLLQAEIGKQ